MTQRETEKFGLLEKHLVTAIITVTLALNAFVLNKVVDMGPDVAVMQSVLQKLSTDLSVAKTPDELKSIWPTKLA